MHSFTLGSLVKALPLLGGLVSAAGIGLSPAGARAHQNRFNRRQYSCDGYVCDAGHYCAIGTNGVPGCCPVGQTCEGPGMVSVYTLTNTLVVVHTSYEGGYPPSAYPTAYTTSTYYYSSPSYPTSSPAPYHSSSSTPCPSSSTSAYPSYPPPPASYPGTVTTPCSTSMVISTPSGYPLPTSYASSTLYPSVSSVYYNSSSSAVSYSSSAYGGGSGSNATSTYPVPPKETSGDAAAGAVARVGIAGVVAALMGLIMA